MTTNFLPKVTAVAALLALATIGVSASDQVGAYCIVKNVVMTPDEAQPAAVQIWGACALATGGMADDHTYTPSWYSAPQAGYLYYRVTAGKEEIARREWKDLKSVAGTGEIVAFGGRYAKMGHMRSGDEKPTGPEPYPIQMGVVKMTNFPKLVDQPKFSYTDLFAALKKAAGVK
jgi:hypothetical protein